MEFELWWLMSWPIFFALGWLAARVDIRHLLRESRSLPRAYLTGLNFLVNDQHDRAIDAFLDAVQVDPKTVELHFALGSLFRRRGEVDRAIRIHQSLVEREDLNADQRLQALEALAVDFFKAGLLDRAEKAYLNLRDNGRHAIATKALLEIYQQEKDWPKAIEMARSLPERDAMRSETAIANFHCEQAAADLTHGRLAQAREQLEAALLVNRKCVRATMLLGNLLVAEGRDADALAVWKKVEQQNPAYLSQVAERIMDAYRRLNDAERGITLLRAWLAQYPSLDLLEAVFQWEMEKQGPQVAYELVRDELKRNPTLLGLEKLLEAAIHTAPADKVNDVELVKGLIHGHTRKVARYRCDVCGFKARQFYWRCPACGGWETYPPRRTEEFDLVP